MKRTLDPDWLNRANSLFVDQEEKNQTIVFKEHGFETQMDTWLFFSFPVKVTKTFDVAQRQTNDSYQIYSSCDH